VQKFQPEVHRLQWLSPELPPHTWQSVCSPEQICCHLWNT
jgi:hypothetical protein